MNRLLTAAIAIAVTACDSPEADRTRGGARGADVNNRNPVVEIHAGSRVYFRTPCLMPDDECTGPLPVSGLPEHFPEQKRARS